MIDIGTKVEIKKAFSSESGRCDLVDEVAGCEGEVLTVEAEDVLLWIKGMGEV